MGQREHAQHAIPALTQALEVEPGSGSGSGSANWRLLTDLCTVADVKGGLLTDAHLAALAIASGSTLVSFGRDFARFAQSRWKHPRDAA